MGDSADRELGVQVTKTIAGPDVRARMQLRARLNGFARWLPVAILGLFLLSLPLPVFAEEEEEPGQKLIDEESEATVGTADGADLREIDPDAFPADDPYSEVEEIRVTGQQGGELVQAAVSEIGFDAYELQRDGIKDIRDLSNFTPNLEIKGAFAASNATLFIRGVGIDDFNANAPSAVAVYQDEIYMQSPAGQLFQFFDVEGVDVLRGPQGVLYRNASAGAILVNSRKPTQVLDAYSTVTYGRFNQVDVEGAVGGGITDSVSARVSGYWGIRDGIVLNRCGDPLYLQANPDLPVGSADQPACYRYITRRGNPLVGDVVGTANNIDNYALRGQLLWETDAPGGDMEWLLNAHGGRSLGQAWQYQNFGVKFSGVQFLAPDVSVPQPILNPETGQVQRSRDSSGYIDDDGDPWAGDYNVQGPETLDLWGTFLRGTWNFDNGYKLESITGYEAHKRYVMEDADAGPSQTSSSIYNDTSWQATQELRVSGAIDAPVSFGDDVEWVVGGFFLKQDLEVDNEYEGTPGSPLQFIQYEQELRAMAVYGMATWVFLENFELQGGVRQNWEQKTFSLRAFTELGNIVNSKIGSEQGTFTGWGANVTLAWQVLPDAELAIKYNRGWKGGHFNGGAFDSYSLISPVRPEVVDSFELNARSRWFDGRLILNGAFFLYDYQDLQVFQLEQTPKGFTIDQLINANDARVYGVEVDMQAEPIDGLNMEFHFAWLNSYYLDFQNELEFTIQTGKPRYERINFTYDFDYSGNPLIAAPKFALAGAVDYSIALPRIGNTDLGFLTPRVSYTWRDEIFFDACSGRGSMCNFPRGTFGEDPLWLFNASLGWWSSDERVQVTLWVLNLTDEVYRTQSFDQTRWIGNILEIYGDPRTYGITVGLYFY